MKIAIIGLPNCGKTTLFNALTGGTAQTASFSSGRLEPNIAAVKVPDPRLEVLKEMYHRKKVVPAEVHYVDVGGFGDRAAARRGLSPELLGYIGTADAFLHVVRVFEDANVPHPQGRIDAAADAGELEQELIFSDLLTVERRLERLEKEVGKITGQERLNRIVEKELLARLRQELEQERPLRDLEITAAEEKLLRGFNFVSSKPVLVVLNIGEDQIQKPPSFKYPYRKSSVISFSARLEAELARLAAEEAREFMDDLGIVEPARERVIRASYELLGLISFLTVGPDEVRAWTVCRGTTAADAAGVIHSDIQRGFIRAEVISFEKLVSAGSMAAAKKQGLLRLEGKEYPVQDGDVCHFLFNV
ncbi:MAG: redox-regulated ATPase YchF [Acidobacteria bacterium]|nr:redox-regulated ATPase YchF [Acidobacteriota bacterium]